MYYILSFPLFYLYYHSTTDYKINKISVLGTSFTKVPFEFWTQTETGTRGNLETEIALNFQNRDSISL